ncbi:MAG: AMP-binding protein [Acidimicrobiia bacterium]
MQPDSPVDWMNRWADIDPDRVALVTPGIELTYGKLRSLVRERVGRFAEGSGLAPIGVTIDHTTVVDLLAATEGGAVVLPFIGDEPTVTAPPDEDDCYVIPTSGSVSRARLVRITASNIAASVVASRQHLGTGASDRWLLCLPLNHVAGLAILWRSLEAGGSVAMAPFDRDLPSFIAATAPTIGSFVPTMVRRLLRSNPECLGSLRFSLVGGAAVDSALVAAGRRAGAELLPTYGMTETTSQVATVPPGSETGGALPLPGIAVRIVDNRGDGVPVGVHGTVTVEGPIVSPGYLGDPERLMPLVTNDIGYFDGSGALHIVGRVDDIVISGGENISLRHVAERIIAIDGVDDAVAVGLPDPEWGSVVAVVVETTLPIDELTAFARAVLAPHEQPKRVVIVSELPLLPNGKHDRAAVTTIAAAG